MQLPYRFGRYVLLKKIAQGGMAEIFKAKYLGESGFSKDVCIKRLLPVWSDNPAFIKMLIDEAKALVHLSHPNIVQVFELGRDGKIFYISMELVEGIDLNKLLERSILEQTPIPLQFGLYIIAEVLKALGFAHQRKDEANQPLGIIHRDISPQNILLSFDGQVKVTDFGIAKGAHRSLETTQHQVKGKYSYMSPEQARGESIDPRTDLYAVGILLFELLENRKLFHEGNDLATLEKVRAGTLPEKALVQWPESLRAAVLKALQKERHDRYGTAESFLKEIEKIMEAQTGAARPEEFSRYLTELFPKKVSEETVAEELLPASVPKKSWRRTLWLGLIPFSFLPLLFWPKPKTVIFEKPKPAILKVSARPWGEVTIPGVLNRQETPITGLRLRSGKYHLEVHYPPTNQKTEKVIQLASGGQTFCQAEFESIPRLVCH